MLFLRRIAEYSLTIRHLLRKIRLALSRRSTLIKTVLPDGLVHYGLNSPGHGGRGLYIYRDEIEPEFAVFTQFIPPGGVFFDVGANTGIYALRAGRHLKDSAGLVVALEPTPNILSVFRKNIEANHLKNVRTRCLCAGATTGAQEFSHNFDKPNSFSLLRHDPNATQESVLVASLDDLVKWEGLQRVDYIKIDAEGAETEILKGAQTLIQQYRPVIQLESMIQEVNVTVENYLGFQAKGSPNRVFVPQEHPRAGLPIELGWACL
jgi:FkbM family methyltransferase